MTVNVKVVATKGNSAIVEYLQAGSLKRRVIPHSAVKDDSVDERTLSGGAAYGVSLSGFKLSTADFIKRLEEELHRRGVWTADDFKRNPTAVQSALVRTIGLDVSALLSFVADLE